MFKVGDKVRIKTLDEILDVEKVDYYEQVRSPGIIKVMLPCFNKYGEIIRIDDVGLLVIDVEGEQWYYHPDWVERTANVYIGGSLFTEAEVTQRKYEADLLRVRVKLLLNEHNINDYEVDIFNPIEQPFNDKTTLPKAEDISSGDYKAMKGATHILFNLDNPTDAGVFMELGEMVESGHAKIYPVISDMRFKTAGEYDGIEVPIGFNQYVIGRLKENNIKIYDNYRDACYDIADEIVGEVLHARSV